MNLSRESSSEKKDPSKRENKRIKMEPMMRTKAIGNGRNLTRAKQQGCTSRCGYGQGICCVVKQFVVNGSIPASNNFIDTIGDTCSFKKREVPIEHGVRGTNNADNNCGSLLKSILFRLLQELKGSSGWITQGANYIMFVTQQMGFI